MSQPRWSKVKASAEVAAPQPRAGHTMCAVPPTNSRGGDTDANTSDADRHPTPTLVLFGGGNPTPDFFDDVWLLRRETQLAEIEENLDGAGASQPRQREAAAKWTWTKLQPAGDAPMARSGHSAVVHCGSLFVFGGISLNFAKRDPTQLELHLNDFWRLDVSSGADADDDEGKLQWQPVTPSGSSVPLPQLSGHSAAVVGGEMWLLCGTLDGAGPQSKVFVYNFSDNSLREEKTSGDAPDGREMHASVAVGAKIFVSGGKTKVGFAPDLCVLDTATLVWSKYDGAGVQLSLCGHGMVAHDGDLVVFGGFTGASASNEIFRISRDALQQASDSAKWEKISPKKIGRKTKRPPARFAHTLTQLPCDRSQCIVFGGVSTEAAFNDVYLLDLKADDSVSSEKQRTTASGDGDKENR